MFIRLAHQTGLRVDIETDTGTFIDGSQRVMDALDRVRDTEWRPGTELDKVTLNFSDGANCLLALERASHFDASVPAIGWRAFQRTDRGTLIPYIQPVGEGASESVDD